MIRRNQYSLINFLGKIAFDVLKKNYTFVIPFGIAVSGSLVGLMSDLKSRTRGTLRYNYDTRFSIGAFYINGYLSGKVSVWLFEIF